MLGFFRCSFFLSPGGATLLLFHLPIRSSALQQGLNPAKCELKEQNKIFIGSVPDLFLHSETQTRGSNELGLLSVRSAEPSAFNQTLAPNEIFPRMNDTRPSWMKRVMADYKLLFYCLALPTPFSAGHTAQLILCFIWLLWGLQSINQKWKWGPFFRKPRLSDELLFPFPSVIIQAMAQMQNRTRSFKNGDTGHVMTYIEIMNNLTKFIIELCFQL